MLSCVYSVYLVSFSLFFFLEYQMTFNLECRQPEQQSSTGPGKQGSFLKIMGKGLQLLECMKLTKVTGTTNHSSKHNHTAEMIESSEVMLLGICESASIALTFQAELHGSNAFATGCVYVFLEYKGRIM